MRKKNFAIIGFLLAICVPGILSLIPLLQQGYEMMVQAVPELMNELSLGFFLTIQLLTSFFVVFISSISGVYFSKKVGMYDSVLKAIGDRQPLVPALKTQLEGAVQTGVLALLPLLVLMNILAAYLGVKGFVNLDGSSHFMMRIFYGGIVEEILARWGVLTFIAWIFSFIFRKKISIAIWIAIILTGLLFGLGQLPSLLMGGESLAISNVFVVMGFSLYSAIVFGWLFWKRGLVAAMVAHILFQILWMISDFIMGTV